MRLPIQRWKAIFHLLIVIVAVAVSVVGTAITVDASVVVDCSPSVSVGAPAAIIGGGFHPMVPLRVFDSRTDGAPIPANCTLVVDLGDVLPPQASGVGLEVVSVDAAGRGWVTAYPCGDALPQASNLNQRFAEVTRNLVLVPVRSNRSVCLYTSVTTHFVVDVEGWFGPGGQSFHSVVQRRVLDTRTSLRPDGGTGPLKANQVAVIPIAGLAPVPSGATAVAVNLTVAGTAAPGHLTAFPCSAGLPLASHGNYKANDVRANQVIVGLDGTGRLCVYTLAATHLIVDVSGWFGGTDGVRFTPIVGTRVLDTRLGIGGSVGPIGGGQTIAFDPSARGTVPVGASTALDVVATQAAAPGFLTMFPCDGPIPPTSTVNFTPGPEGTNAAVVPVGPSGLVCIWSSATVHLVVDVLGSFGPAGALRSLDVSPGPLTPAFTPDAHDYGVICAPGGNQWTVSGSPVPGAVVTVNGASPGPVTVNENAAVVVSVAKANGVREEYWIRCLPSDFPVLTVDRPDDPSPGWYLFATGLFGGVTYAVILDEHGSVVWYQKTPGAVLDFKRLWNGHIAWKRFLGGGFGFDPNGAYEERLIDGSLVRRWATVGSPTDHHDFYLLPNGNALLGSYPIRTGVDVSGLGSSFASPASVAEALIQEIRPDGSLAWQWRSQDHIAVSETTAHLDGVQLISATPSGNVVDLIHMNSLDVDAATGDVIMSARHLDAVFRIRRNPGGFDDGRVLWKLGGNAPTDPATLHFAIDGDPLGGPARQHDARLSPDGFLTVFDNQTNRPGTAARGLEYGLDAAAGTATMVWQFRHPAGSQASCCGSTRDQPDASVVIGWGGTPPLFTEVGPWGNVTLQVTQVPFGSGYRAIKEQPGAFSRSLLRANAGK